MPDPMPEPETDEPADEAGESADEAAGESAVDWSALPEPLRVRLAELGADALGEMAKVDVPQHLRPVARFAPTKRARLGGAQVVAGLRDSANFRTAVVEWLRKNRPSTLEVTAPDPVTAAAAAVLTGDEVAPHYVELVSRRVGDATLRAERDAAVV
ncbi:RNA-binding protein, partial [Lentzea sp. NPDC060358]